VQRAGLTQDRPFRLARFLLNDVRSRCESDWLRIANDRESRWSEALEASMHRSAMANTRPSPAIAGRREGCDGYRLRRLRSWRERARL